MFIYAGPMHRSRFTFAAYAQMGYADCVTHSPEAYVAKALALACDAEQRRAAVDAIVHSRSEVIEDTQSIGAFCKRLNELL